MQRVVDAHLHFYDYQQNRHLFLEKTDPGYEAFVGDYRELPRRYLLNDYLANTKGYKVEAVVWHEFLSQDPIKEAKWAQHIADTRGIRHALVAKVDFLDPDIEATLDQYSELTHLTAVREHMVWDDANPLKRFAKRPDLLTDRVWLKQLHVLERYRFKCGLEVFAPQLSDLADVIRHFPNISFTLAVMAWPLDLGHDGFDRWRCDLKRIASCDNVCLDISALECIFGMRWSVAEATPWVHAAFDAFGISRCMFGSHLPIANLSTGFAELYRRYGQFVEGCTAQEIDDVFYNVANHWFTPS